MKNELLFVLLFVYSSYANDYYSIDGTGNNLQNSTWGRQGQQVVRDNPTIGYNYLDGVGAMRTDLPNPRDLSNTFYARRPSNVYSKLNVNDLHTAWGLLLAHDIARSQGRAESAPISLPYSDTNYNPWGLNSSQLIPSRYVIGFNRKTGTVNATVDSPRNQFSASTPYLDFQTFYGMNNRDMQAFRNLSSNGKLKTSSGNLLPLDPRASGYSSTFYLGQSSNLTYFAGDFVGQFNPTCVAILTMFMREHNRVAEKYAMQHPEWNDTQVFNEARRWVIALYQSITINEYMPATTSRPLRYGSYNSTLQPAVTALFMAATCRYGHSEVNGVINFVDEKGNYQQELLRDTNWKASTQITRYGCANTLRGAMNSPQQEIDLFYEDDMRNYVFGLPGRSGNLDAAATTIQRTRDFGIPSYNDLREAFGLKRLEFNEITSDTYVQNQLISLYNNDTDAIDFWVGALAEDHPGRHFGDLLTEAFENQIRRSIESDRLYYKWASANFTTAEIQELESTKLSTLLLRHFPELEAIQCSAFFASTVKDCGKLPEKCNTTSPSTTTLQLLNNNFNVTYSLSGDVMTFTLSVATTGWVAMGFAETAGQMVGSDVYAGWVSGNTLTFGDYKISDKQKCSGGVGVCPDTTQNIASSSGSEADGITTITFSRKLNTGDSEDIPVTVNTDIPIVVAYGAADSLAYHGSSKEVAYIRFNVVNSATTTASVTSATTQGSTPMVNAQSQLSVSIAMLFAVLLAMMF